MSAQTQAQSASLPSTYAPAPGHRFKVGNLALIKPAFPPGHRRTPHYIRGKEDVTERICGAFPNPEKIAYGFDDEPKTLLYRARFPQNHVWPGHKGSAHDVIEMEIFEHRLLPVSKKRITP